MSSNPTISIVMPVRDGEATVASAIESIRQQTIVSWELLVVDDGSRDATPAILDSFARADGRIRVITQESLGIVEALRRGCDAASGGYIARMDADDWSAPERLRHQQEFLDLHPEIGLVSSLVRHGGDPVAQAGYATHVAWINSLLTPEAIALRRFVESPVAHPSVMFRRDLLARCGHYAAGDFPEDYELWLRWMGLGVQFGKVEAELLVWNDLPARLSRKDNRYCIDAFYHTKCVYLAQWLKQRVAPSRGIWLRGAGRISRRRFLSLETEGIQITGFVDVDQKKFGRLRDGRPVVGPHCLPPQQDSFIIVAVASRGARELIHAELQRQGRVEGRDYLLAA